MIHSPTSLSVQIFSFPLWSRGNRNGPISSLELSGVTSALRKSLPRFSSRFFLSFLLLASTHRTATFTLVMLHLSVRVFSPRVKGAENGTNFFFTAIHNLSLVLFSSLVEREKNTSWEGKYCAPSKCNTVRGGEKYLLFTSISVSRESDFQ